MKILGIDTSNQTMTVALVENNSLIAEKTINIKRNHSIQLMPAIETLFKEVNWAPNELSRIVVAKGPGSYTGVRIGVTVAKTLAFSLNIDLVGISSLKVLAANGERLPGSYIVPLFDARRSNVFTGLYRYEEGVLVQVEEDTHLPIETVVDYLNDLQAPIQFIGEDRLLHSETIKKIGKDRLIQLPLDRHLPRASTLVMLGMNEEPDDRHLFEPEYIKLAEAEQKWMEAHPNRQQGGGWIEKY